VIEQGYPDFEAIAWIGFLAPGGTPKPIVDRYHREIARIAHTPEVKEKLEALSFEVVATSPEEFRQ
jgi:tripartite-type tricarboxylate transporter receptor subunit TctC